MTVKPISPKEAFEAYAHLPDKVTKTWNALIVKNRSGRGSVVKQDDAVEALRAAMSEDHQDLIPRQRVFDEGWLEIEEVFRAAGWKVEYDKPAYCETYPATFTFTARK